MPNTFIPAQWIVKYLVDRGFETPRIMVANYAKITAKEYSQLLNEIAQTVGVPRDKIEEDIICHTTYAGMPYSGPSYFGSDLRIDYPFNPTRKRIYSFKLFGYTVEIWKKEK
jgi:hypothetical protein